MFPHLKGERAVIIEITVLRFMISCGHCSTRVALIKQHGLRHKQMS